MTARSGYCPFCDASIPAPLLPLDYRNCKRCGAIVAEEDIVRKTNMLQYGGGGERGFWLDLIGSKVHYDITQTIDTVVTNASFSIGELIVVAISTAGANQHPNTVTAGGTTLAQAVSSGSTNTIKTSVYYGVSASGGSSVTTFWTGQHPITAIITVYKSRVVPASPINATYEASGYAAYTNATPGISASPTSKNVFALLVLGVGSSGEMISNTPPGMSIYQDQLYTNNSLAGDACQATFYKDCIEQSTLSSVAPLSGVARSNAVIVIFNKT